MYELPTEKIVIIIIPKIREPANRLLTINFSYKIPNAKHFSDSPNYFRNFFCPSLVSIQTCAKYFIFSAPVRSKDLLQRLFLRAIQVRSPRCCFWPSRPPFISRIIIWQSAFVEIRGSVERPEWTTIQVPTPSGTTRTRRMLMLYFGRLRYRLLPYVMYYTECLEYCMCLSSGENRDNIGR